MSLGCRGFALAIALGSLVPLATRGAVFVVTSTADSSAGSLRDAIAQANVTAGTDTVVFDLPEPSCSSAGVCRIDLATTIEILDPVIVDGTTQPRYGTAPANVCATASADSYMRVEIVGPPANFQGALRIQEGGNPGVSTIRGLAIGGGTAVSILLAGPQRVQCNHLGVDGPGVAALPFGAATVLIERGADGAILGTDGDGVDDLGERNVIAGEYGVYNNANPAVRIAGNWFGLAADGTAPLPCTYGVYFRQQASGNRIGTNFDGISDDLERNVFANCGTGAWANTDVEIAPGDENVIAGNWFGLDAHVGIAPCQNFGIFLNSWGADTVVRGNRIESNPVGIRVEDFFEAPGTGFAPESEYNCLAGNTIGLEHVGMSALHFENNWWGAPDGPSGLLPGSGDPIQVTGGGSVDVTPFLTDGCPVPEPGAGPAALAAIGALALAGRSRR